MAAVSSTAKDDLHCAVCFEIFQDPVSLLCGHTYCRRCVGRIKDRRQRRIKCPLKCEQLTQLDDDMENKLPPNWEIRGLVEKHLKKLERRKPAFQCHLTEKQKTEVFCEHCKVIVDLACFEDEHQTKGHKFKSRQNFQSEIRKRTTAQGEQFKKQIDIIKKRIDRKEGQCLTVRSAMDILREDIKTTFNAKIGILTDNKNSLINEVNEIERSMMNHLEDGMTDDRVQVEQISVTMSNVMNDILCVPEADNLESFLQNLEDNDELLSKFKDCDKVSELVKEQTENTKFYLSDENLTDLGTITTQINV